MKKRYIATTIALMILTASVTFAISQIILFKEYNSRLGNVNQDSEIYKKLDEIGSIVNENFVGDYSASNVSDGVSYGYIAGLGDKWSYYLTREEFSKIGDAIENRYVGIGVEVSYDEETGGILVFNVQPNSPASASGIEPFDIILKVSDKSVNDLGYNEAVDLVRGEEGTKVTLSVFRPATKQTKELTVTRKKIDIVTVSGEMLGDIGYVRISSFDSQTTEYFKKTVSELKEKKAKGIIFDVRNNPGGTLDSLIKVLDYVLPEGVIITERDKKGTETAYKSVKGELGLPMVVLINDRSISAAEFFAAAVKDYKKGTLIGIPTTGKGFAQKTIGLKDGSGLVLSVTKYYTPKGISLIDTKGIKPDIEVKLTEEQQKYFYKLSKANDPQIQKALEVLKK